MELVLASILIPVLSFVLLTTLIFVVIRNEKYKEYVLTHSVSLKALDEINSKYEFNTIGNFDMEHSYDNANFYDDISCQDYLIYNLVYKQKEVSNAIRNAKFNNAMFKTYSQEVKDKCSLGIFDSEATLKSKEKINKTESKLFRKKIKTPVTKFTIKVRLILTRIDGSFRRRKDDEFDSKDIQDLINDINQKNGTFYRCEYIWNAICKVERGKVTNRLRFAIYRRDGNRCRRCGRTRYLEIDHIVPISKGGKSTYDNLQTLCQRCNREKGTTTRHY